MNVVMLGLSFCVLIYVDKKIINIFYFSVGNGYHFALCGSHTAEN